MRLIISVGGNIAYDHFKKSGFSHIAKGANVPIPSTFISYSKKKCSFGKAIQITLDVKSGMDKLRNFNTIVQGKFLTQLSTARHKEEAQSELNLFYGELK